MCILPATLAAACSGSANRSPIEATPTVQSAARVDPRDVVRAFYVLLNERKFDQAYNLLTPAWQQTVDNTPYDKWVKGYENTTLINPLTISIREQDPQRATVQVEIESVDRDVSGRVVNRTYQGTWELARHEDSWLLDHPQISPAQETVYDPPPQVTGPPPPQQSTPTPTSVRRVIVVAGIDSSSSCSNVDSMSRQTALEDALQTTSTENLQVIGLSYSGQYQDCTYNTLYGAQTIPDVHGHVLADYAKMDTCQGVTASAASLDQLVEHLWKPGITFDLIGHSLGGLVTSYFISQKSASYVQQRIHSVLLLDSPVQGVQFRNPLSSCSTNSQSWLDLGAGSYVTRTIDNSAATTSKVLFVTIRSSPIGSILLGAQDLLAGCYSDGSGGLFLGFLANLIVPGAGLATLWLDISGAHNCVWYDRVSLNEIAQVISR